MHKGARFHQCDFQVHSPRDPNWTGVGRDRPTTDAERQAWADSLVAASRTKQLHAIAITDHHDYALVQVVRDAADRERGGDGQPLPADQRLIVFPGMELTLGLPCQCLLLFDAAFPIEHLDQLPGVLGYTATPAAEPTARQATTLSQVNHPNDVIERLERLAHFKGHFIVLPHVQENGHKTLIRAGFQDQYRAFRGCGGYVDGALPPVGTGARKILDGRDANYGNKPLAVFQTSDCRVGDFSTLGRTTSWVKWATPTTEALRQSCLARHSRLSQTIPKLPDIQLRRVEVSNSVFLGRLNLFLNPQYNALIGGRGTGKSSLLEYLRWALCAPRAGGSFEDEPEHERRARALIDSTLLAMKGQIRVWASVNGVEHIVERSTDPAGIRLRVAAEEFRASTEEEIQRLLPVEAYSQKHLSAIGGTKGDVLKFLLSPVSGDVKRVEDELRSADDELRAKFTQLQAALTKQKERTVISGERDSLVKQREARRGDLKGLSEADGKTLRDGEKYAEETKLVEEWRVRTGNVVSKIDALVAELKDFTAPAADTPSHTLLRASHADLQNEVVALRASVAALRQRAVTNSSKVADLAKEHATILDAARVRYREAAERSKGHQESLKEIERLNQNIAQLDARIQVLDGELEKLAGAEAEFNQARTVWRAVIERRGTLTKRRCEQVSADSGGDVRGVFRPCADARRSVELLAEVARGARLRSEKLESLVSTISASQTALDDWERFMDEVRSLVGIRTEEAELPHCPSLRAVGMSDKELRGLASKLDEETWMRLRLAAPNDVVEFQYKTREGNYIAFHVASAGQRATALMRLLLAQAGGPLIIDQPEDDLDNRVIHEIAESLAKAKQNRQLIFASHNANLVVNGDADLIAVFNYKVAGEQTAGEVAHEGAIDDPAVCDAVTTVMEGGRNAFVLRRDKYGF